MPQNEIRDKLIKYGQEHVLKFYGELDEGKKEMLDEQLENIDLDLLGRLFASIGSGHADGCTDKIEPMPCAVKEKFSAERRNTYYGIGMDVMRRGAYAAVTMAGGQGTRLGHTGPKGTFYVDVPEHMSLFEIQCKRLISRSRECCRYIPWYIMTSEENDADTRRFFGENGYFGYPPDHIIFFRQLMMPMLDEKGKLIMEDRHKIKTGADGHGGIFRAMYKSGIIDDMHRRGIEWIFVGGIDNILVRLADPVLTGYLASEGYLLGGKSIIKRDAHEKAGVFCMKNGRPSVIEYTEISEELAGLRDGNGDFVYGDAHILCNMFNIKVLEKMRGAGLPYHTAHKRSDYLDENGCRMTPDAPNAYKFESFIFDAFSYCDKMGVLRVKREEEFAPIKNKTGEDSPETAVSLYMKGACVCE